MDNNLDSLVNPDATTLEGLEDISNHAKAALIKGKQQMLQPDAEKSAPKISLSELAAVYETDYDKFRKRFAYQASLGKELPIGFVKNSDGDLVEYDGKTKTKVLYPLTDISKIVKALYPQWTRPDGVDGVVVTICNYKGGVTKSTTTVSYAQVLTLRGLKVLVIDFDPLGTSTKWLATKPITREECCVNLFAEQEGSLRDYILPSYWPGIDLVPAHQLLQNVESHFHNLLHSSGPSSVQYVPKEIVKLKADYDVILIDTPPSLNNLTLSALFSSDGIVMPLVPSNPDIESASDFWRLYIDTCRVMGIQASHELFQFVRILISKADMSSKSTQNMIDWINNSYPNKVMRTQIPKAAAVATAADSFGTVFDDASDLSRGAKTSRDQMRAIYASSTSELASLIYGIWQRESSRREYLAQNGLA